MPLNALLEATAPSTAPASGAPFLFAYETARTASGDPVFRIYRGPVAPVSLVVEFDEDVNLAVVGNVDGVDVAALKLAHDALSGALTAHKTSADHDARYVTHTSAADALALKADATHV